MKVVLFGSKTRVMTFANHLVKTGVEVHVISNRVMNDGSYGLVNPGIIFHIELINKLKQDDKNPYAKILLPFTLIKFRRLIFEIKPDIIHVFFISWHGWLTALSGFHPFVLTTMGADINNEQGAMKNYIGKILTSYTVRKANSVTVQTEQGFNNIKNIDSTKRKIIFRAGFLKHLFYKDKKPEHLLDFEDSENNVAEVSRIAWEDSQRILSLNSKSFSPQVDLLISVGPTTKPYFDNYEEA